MAGSIEAREHSRRAERNEPRLRTHDRHGHRVDEVELDPSWHWLLRGAIERELHSLPWRDPQPGAHVARAALMALWGNANGGVLCPVSMTYAAVPALRDGAPELAAAWEPRLTRPDYDAGAARSGEPGRRAGGKPAEAQLRRFATAVMKYWVCKRAAPHAAEALECLGGNGYVEDSGMPLLYRDAPLGSIWEGSGNASALDVLRAIVREPAGLSAFIAECELAAGGDGRLDAHLARVRRQAQTIFREGGDSQCQGRRVVEDLAVALQGSLPVRYAPAAVADAFCAARLGGEGGRVYGTLPLGVDAQAIVERALPA